MSALTIPVLVVGAGPAGSAVALRLARRGVDVAVLDRAVFPRAKPCGECVNPGAVQALRRLGVFDAVFRAAPAPVTGWRIRNTRGVEALGRYPRDATCGWGIRRWILDAVLLDEARRAGARIVEGERVVHVGRAASGRWVLDTVREGIRRSWQAELLVGADGLRSTVARRCGLVARSPRLRKVSFTYRLRGRGPSRACGTLVVTGGQTIGLAPVHATEPLWNGTIVTTADGARAVRRDPAGAFRLAFADGAFGWHAGSPELVAGPWASGPFDWPTRAATADGVVLLGDAAGYYDPLTGQGIYQALRSAEIAAPFVEAALGDHRRQTIVLGGYDRVLQRELRATRVLQRIIEAALAHRTSREVGIGALARLPAVAHHLIRRVGDAAPPRMGRGLSTRASRAG